MWNAAISRDQWGIPHIRSDDSDGLAFGQGAVTAQDRAWQLEAGRRRAEGTLAEVVGKRAVDWDVLARRIRLDDLARRAYSVLDERTRRWVMAYVAGVNDTREKSLASSIELDELGIDLGEWRPWTPLGVLAVQHVLFGAYPNKLWRAHIMATLGPQCVPLFAMDASATLGSNAWALTGDLTAMRSPLLAGDPHRAIEAPGVYQQVHLVCTEFDVVGLAFPGVPGVQHFGHTGTAAWAVTNATADDQDLFVEELRLDGDSILVRDASGWVKARSHQERIDVRGSKPLDIRVIETPRGALVLGGPGVACEGAQDTDVGIALRTPAHVLGDLGLSAIPLLLRARTAHEVEAAWSHWIEPVNSVLIADSRGTVLRIVAGRVPQRPASNRVVPVAGSDPATAWTGWEDLPSTDVRALGGFAVCANDRRAGDTAHLGTDFAPPHRARRITELIVGLVAAGRRVTVDDCARMHLDSRLGTLDTLRALIAAIVPSSARGWKVRERLLSWDGMMSVDSEGAALFARWREAFVQRLAADPALAPLYRQHEHLAVYPVAFDVPSRVGLALENLVVYGSDMGLNVLGIADAAMADLADEATMERTGSKTPELSSWGDLHVLEPAHILPPSHPGRPNIPAIGLGGDIDCVLAAASRPGVSHTCSHGPVARYIWDLQDRSASRWVVPLGASGHWDSPHALDQLQVYASGGLLPVVDDLDRTQVERVVIHP